MLTNGTFGPAGLPDQAALDQTLSIRNNTVLTYALDTAANPNGYTISSINTYSGWRDAGRDNQDYTVSVATVDDPGVFIPLTTVGFGVGSGSSEVTIAASSATRIGEVRFDFGAQENGYVGYRELDVIGSPTPSGTVTITINGENDPVTANDDTGATDEDSVLVVDVAANEDDVDVNDMHTVAEIEGDNSATVTLPLGRGSDSHWWHGQLRPGGCLRLPYRRRHDNGHVHLYDRRRKWQH